MASDESTNPEEDLSFAIELSGTRLTQFDAIEFLENVATVASCSACGNTTWDVIFGPGEGNFLVIASSNGAGRSGKQMPVFGATCQTCGHIRFHTLAKLREWVNEKAGKESEADQGDSERGLS